LYNIHLALSAFNIIIKEEVKIRLTDYKAMEQALERLGAKFFK